MSLQAFLESGVRLLHAEDELRARLRGIKALVFDWDGVFNNSFKDADGGSPFSEVDSMGVNLLRFALWKREEQLPVCAIITGQQNSSAERFAQREKMHGLYMGWPNKGEPFDAFLRTHRLHANEVAFFFDDVLDLAIAERCGLRILMGHPSAHLFQRTSAELGCADAIIPQSGGRHGLREACDLLMVLHGNWTDVVDDRRRFSTAYQRYLMRRQAITPEVVRQQR